MIYAEVCGHGEVRAARDQAAVDAKVSAFFEHGFIREHRLRGADAIHLASAIRSSCQVLMTWNKNDFPVGDTVEGVDVREPFLFGQRRLGEGGSDG
ncbi:MAG: hypothetical protein ACYC1D_00845 [Acidimicrobiales bacterium]